MKVDDEQIIWRLQIDGRTVERCVIGYGDKAISAISPFSGE